MEVISQYEGDNRWQRENRENLPAQPYRVGRVMGLADEGVTPSPVPKERHRHRHVSNQIR